VLRAEIDGSLVMKSFIRGNPELRLALNEDLVVGRGSRTRSSCHDMTMRQ
jgi:AP-4 complex subunit mu-1